MKKEFIVGVFLIIIAGLFTKFKFFDEKSELKYSLSQKIDSDFLINNEEFGIQQLTLKNSGDIVVNDIVIKINSKILDFKVKKFTNKDSIFTSNSDSNFELNYPKLPPMGEIIVLVKSSGITYKNIEIYHSKGKALEIFENNSPIESSIFYFLIIFYLLLSLYSLKNIYTDSLKSKASYDSAKVLKKKIPWYVDKDKWVEIRSVAVNNYFKKEYFIKIENRSYYNFLNENENENITEDEKSKLNEIAINLLMTNITDALSTSYFTSELDQLKSLKKPKNISIEKWESILENISKVTLTKTLRDLFVSDLSLYNDKNVIKVLENSKPQLLREEDWIKLKDILSNYYVAIVLTDIVKNENYDAKVKWELINEDNKRKLNGILTEIKDSKNNIEYYSELLHFLRKSLYWTKIPERPALILEEDWLSINELFNNIIQSQINGNNDLKEAFEIKNKFYLLKEKISNQLEIINDVLNDPNSIDKIEIYNIPFEKGNWENLLKLSHILKNKS